MISHRKIFELYIERVCEGGMDEDSFFDDIFSDGNNKEMEMIFINMISKYGNDLRLGNMPKGKFIGKYISELNLVDKENTFRYKSPQVVSTKEGENWLDYILSLSDEEYSNLMSLI